MRFKIAFRNVFRNSRRTILSLFMIGGGVASILVFEGFARNLVTGLRETTIQTDTAHIQIASKSYWARTAKTPKESLLMGYQGILKTLRADKHVQFASGRLSFFGLLSHGDQSQSARGLSFESQYEKSRNESFRFITGKPLSPKAPFQIAVGIGLAKRLEIKPGSRLTVLGHTMDGTVNAIDVEVSGIFQTAISEFDDNTFLIALSTAQMLLDTQGVEMIAVGLKSTGWTEAAATNLAARLPMGVELKRWHEVAKLYNQVSSFNSIQNRVVEFIIVALILLGIMNTISMSIFERTGEIGTTRALGETEGSLIRQFVLEGAILGFLGAAVGALLGAAIAALINWSKIPLVIPGASTFLTIRIDLFPQAFRDSTLLALLASTLAAVYPAVRATRLHIATALRHNI